jgi:pre-mRNA-processing factor 19
MSLTCELSGEPIVTSKETIVATPSGRICIKRLLLQKLTENGGMDPFETIRERPLSEDQLIELKINTIVPPRPQATSLPNLLSMIQSEYDALVLELFETRKALEDTRRELSQALYQNDAAVRVVARLAMEKDAIQQELERWNASVGVTSKQTNDEPESKRRKVDPSDTTLANDLPEKDLTEMVNTWQRLHSQRKPMLKAAAASAPSRETVATYTKTTTKNWHKSTCRNVLCMASHGGLLATAADDKQVVVYSSEDEMVKFTFTTKNVPSCLDIYESLLAVCDSDGHLVVYSIEDGSSRGEIMLTDTQIVNVKVHPTTKHICLVSSDGRVLVCVLEVGKLSIVAEFKGDNPVEYTCGAVHPDGLLYAAGTRTGEIHMWDFKNRNLASTMKVSFGFFAVMLL